MLLNVLSRKGDGCRAMQLLIHDCHESPKAKKEHTKRAWQLFRSLLDRKIIEFIPKTADGAYLRVNRGACRTIFRWTRRFRFICWTQCL